MSNQAVGSVYEGIIEDVIKKSKEDFEEGGVDETVLEALREVSRTDLLTCSYHSRPVFR
jgi:transcription initiation factor TFIIA large subunit